MLASYITKSFDFVIKTPPVAIQLLEVAKVKSGSAEPNRKKVAELTWEQVRTIAQDKMVDLNCFTVEAVSYTHLMRLSELIGLDNKDVDFSASLLKVTGKRNKQRLIPFGDELQELMLEYINVRRCV